MADDNLLEPILEPRTITLTLADHRHNNRIKNCSRHSDFIALSVTNTMEWVMGEGLSKEQVKCILEDEERSVEVNLVRYQG